MPLSYGNLTLNLTSLKPTEFLSWAEIYLPIIFFYTYWFRLYGNLHDFSCEFPWDKKKGEIKRKETWNNVWVLLLKCKTKIWVVHIEITNFVVFSSRLKEGVRERKRIDLWTQSNDWLTGEVRVKSGMKRMLTNERRLLSSNRRTLSSVRPKWIVRTSRICTDSFEQI